MLTKSLWRDPSCLLSHIWTYFAQLSVKLFPRSCLVYQPEQPNTHTFQGFNLAPLPKQSNKQRKWNWNLRCKKKIMFIVSGLANSAGPQFPNLPEGPWWDHGDWSHQFALWYLDWRSCLGKIRNCHCTYWQYHLVSLFLTKLSRAQGIWNFTGAWGARQVQYSCKKNIFTLRLGFLLARQITAEIMKATNIFSKEKTWWHSYEALHLHNTHHTVVSFVIARKFYYSISLE